MRLGPAGRAGLPDRRKTDWFRSPVFAPSFLPSRLGVGATLTWDERRRRLDGVRGRVFVRVQATGPRTECRSNMSRSPPSFPVHSPRSVLYLYAMRFEEREGKGREEREGGGGGGEEKKTADENVDDGRRFRLVVR